MALSGRERAAVRLRLRHKVNTARPHQLQEGMWWYGEARQHCLELSLEHKVDLPSVCGVVAALSPRIQWKRNLRVADELLSGTLPNGVFERSVRSALQVLATGKPPSGPKVSAFARALAGDQTAVVIDSIMLDACGIERHRISHVGVYDQLVDIIREEAPRAGLTPCEYQATVWVIERGRPW